MLNKYLNNSSHDLLGYDNVQCWGRITTFGMAMLPPPSGQCHVAEKGGVEIGGSIRGRICAIQ
jgi:hypothetical protein